LLESPADSFTRKSSSLSLPAQNSPAYATIDTKRRHHHYFAADSNFFSVFHTCMISISQYPSINLNPQLRIQVLLENEAGAPTKEFKAGAMSEPTFDALVAHVFDMACFSHDSLDQYDVTFKYQIEQLHGSRFVNFDSTEGLGYAIQSTQDKKYMCLSLRLF
jgi:hypothetical protein